MATVSGSESPRTAELVALEEAELAESLLAYSRALVAYAEALEARLQKLEIILSDDNLARIASAVRALNGINTAAREFDNED